LKGEEQLALSLQEDFVILKHEANALRTEYLSVCFPSRWDPREKLGLDFSQIHAPVADNQMLLAAGSSIMTTAFMKQPMLRYVWLIVPSASLPQHPDQNDYSWAETLRDPSPLLPRLFFRVERQTTWPLPQFNRAVFFIRVMMSSLVDVLRIPSAVHLEPREGSRGRELASALRSMTPAVVAYRGMTEAMPRLLAELDAFD
jgi:dimethylamine monooxygenase subunit A